MAFFCVTRRSLVLVLHAVCYFIPLYNLYRKTKTFLSLMLLSDSELARYFSSCILQLPSLRLVSLRLFLKSWLLFGPDVVMVSFWRLAPCSPFFSLRLKKKMALLCILKLPRHFFFLDSPLCRLEIFVVFFVCLPNFPGSCGRNVVLVSLTVAWLQHNPSFSTF